jgi:hypothetical protein
MSLPIPYQKIMSALADYYVLTEQQLRRLLYPNQHSMTQGNLPRMQEEGLVEVPGFVPLRPKNNPGYYRLTAPARRSMGLDRRNAKPVSDWTMQHTMAINDFLIGARIFAWQHPQISLVTELHDLTLKRRPLYAVVEKKRRKVIPDAIIVFANRANDLVGICLEIDRDTNQNQREWREKIAGLLAITKEPFQREFLVAYPTFAIVVAEGDAKKRRARMIKLKQWTELALTQLGARPYGQFFLFAAPLDLTEELIPRPIWFPAFGDEPGPLLEVGGA